jgi:hypothetical protein
MTKQMSHGNIELKLVHAINTKTKLILTVKYGLGDELTVDFDPYIYGEDIMQYPFVWGFLPHSRNFYKFGLDRIIEAKDTIKRFLIESDAVYLYGLEESHKAVVKGLERVFPGGIPKETNL